MNKSDKTNEAEKLTEATAKSAVTKQHVQAFVSFFYYQYFITTAITWY